jgi:hypothetical protein
MARLFEDHNGYRYWNPDRCEEIIFIAAFDDVKRYVPPGPQERFWVDKTELHFFERGAAIADVGIAELNKVLKRKGAPPVIFVETDLSHYGRVEDRSTRAQRRQELRDEFEAMTPAQRENAVAAARREQATLPPPHHTHEEWKAHRDILEAKGLREVEHMNGAVAPQPVPAAPEPEPAERHRYQTRQPSIRRLFANNPGIITTADIVRALPDTPRISIQSALSALMDKGEIERVRHGVYRRVGGATEQSAALLKLFRLASSPELRAKIIAQIDPDTAIDLRETIDDAELRDILIEHCLEAVS